MRTLSMRDDLVEKAEAAARRQGVTLEAWTEKALERALDEPRLDSPTFTSQEPGSLRLTNEDIRRMEEEDDLIMLGRAG